ncbi:unnamed protein product [Leuciscus chuanchicus]
MKRNHPPPQTSNNTNCTTSYAPCFPHNCLNNRSRETAHENGPRECPINVKSHDAEYRFSTTTAFLSSFKRRRGIVYINGGCFDGTSRGFLYLHFTTSLTNCHITVVLLCIPHVDIADLYWTEKSIPPL